jgi:hypothetical protein
MTEHSQEQHLARIAGDIMFGDQYLDLLDRIYSEQLTMSEFETNPKYFLIRHGIPIPEGIDVLIHEKGSLGKPGRVDFHWGDSVPIAREETLAARRKFRSLAHQAWSTIHSPEMRSLVKTMTGDPAALKAFASDPKAYLQTRGISVPDGIDVILHSEDQMAPRVDLHFRAPGPISSMRRDQKVIGCYYCVGGECCCYQEN